ncbi:MAG TPA: right-handed parallel beta-helix repeat-containing protein [Trebonia sp.]|nr:right-handed parallel beta-helix repeat-containing protein [Trebonia sp.]
MAVRAARVIVAAAVAWTIAVAAAGCTGTPRSTRPAPSPSTPARTATTPSARSTAPAVTTSPAVKATQPATTAPAVTRAPAAPLARVCGNSAILDGPATAPPGAVKVPAGDNGDIDFSQPNTTYWFAPGTHTLGTGTYANIQPASGDTYIGAPGAILDGQHKNNSAFDGTAEHVTIEYLTIRDFGTWGSDQQEGVVNHDSGAYWTIFRSTISGNAGAGVMLGSHNVLSWNCLQANQQYGFNAYSGDGAVTGLLVDYNEIAGNDTYDYEGKQPGCGCSGGGKFWNVIGAAVTDNWIHGNASVGLWADTNNAGFAFKGNYFQDNESVALVYEISYNAVIEYNTFNRNGVTGGPKQTGFPTSAVYISESGNDSRVNSQYKNSPLLIAHNIFVDNWSGVILWENSNRFCASPDNTSSGYCTMVSPKATLKACGTAALVKAQPYFSDCRWKTQRVLVEFNKFTFTPSAIGSACTAARGCGYNGVISEYGSDPAWSPYHGDIVPTDIAFHQDNKFYDNSYSGPWCFMGWELGTSVSFSQWRASASVSDDQFGQDAHSVHTGASWSCS